MTETTQPRKEYRCYHCDEVFYREDGSADKHFGCSMVSDPACIIDMQKFRELEKQLQDMTMQLLNESTPLEKEIVRPQNELVSQSRIAEEKGYAKRLEDSKQLSSSSQQKEERTLFDPFDITEEIELEELSKHKFFELVLLGFDGGTDKTDHLVKWVAAPNEEVLRGWIETNNLVSIISTISEIKDNHPVSLDFDTGLDVIIQSVSCHIQKAENNHPAVWRYEVAKQALWSSEVAKQNKLDATVIGGIERMNDQKTSAVSSSVTRWQVGDRVTRKVYFDDGTWQREGDACLNHSPKYHGTVVARSQDRDDEVLVLFDGMTLPKIILDHGLEMETTEAKFAKVVGNDGKFLGFICEGEVIANREHYKFWPDFIESAVNSLLSLLPLDRKSPAAIALIAKDDERIAELKR